MDHSRQEAAGPDRIERVLAAARDTRAKVRHGWIVTLGQGGEPNARVVSMIPGVPGEDEWTLWFLTSKASRKVADIRRDERVTLGFQHDPDSAYVALAGRATIVDDRPEIARRWEPGWDLVFPAGAVDPDAVFVKVSIERIELWNLALKVTPAPFGKAAAVLERSGAGPWVRLA